MHFSLVASDGVVYWVEVDSICSIFLIYSSGYTLGVGSVLYFTLESLEICFFRGVWGVGSASMFGSWIVASIVL